MKDSPDPISSELRDFIAKHVHSVEQLEILCLFANSLVSSFSEAEVYHAIQSSPESVAARLRQFVADGLLTHSGGNYRFSAKDAPLDRLAVELARTYRERRVTIVEAIYQPPQSPIRQFAEAFRMRKEK